MIFYQRMPSTIMGGLIEINNDFWFIKLQKQKDTASGVFLNIPTKARLCQNSQISSRHSFSDSVPNQIEWSWEPKRNVSCNILSRLLGSWFFLNNSPKDKSCGEKVLYKFIYIKSFLVGGGGTTVCGSFLRPFFW